MTKNEMEETVKERCLRAWEDMKYCTKEYGKKDIKTVIARSKWVSLDSLYVDLFGREIKY